MNASPSCASWVRNPTRWGTYMLITQEMLVLNASNVLGRKSLKQGHLNLYATAFKSNCLCLGYDILPSRPFKFLRIG
jgi:hypothetical protein